MNLKGFQPIHESNVKQGETYYLRTRFGAGYVIPREDLKMSGWNVELQLGAEFNTPAQKKLRCGAMMTVEPNSGSWYEPKG